MQSVRKLVALFTFFGIILLIIIILQATNFIEIVPTDIMGTLTVLSLLATISGPISSAIDLAQPNLSFLDYNHWEFHEPVEIEIIHAKGKFKIRLLLTGIKNTGGWLSKSAEKCQVDMLLPGSSFPRRLPFRVNQKLQVKIDQEVNPVSGQEIIDALGTTLFGTREVDIKRGQPLQAIIGFFVESGKFYFATEDALELPLAKGDALMGVTPFSLIPRGLNFSTGKQSKEMVIFGPNWKEAQIGFIQKDEKIENNEYRSIVKFPKPIKISNKLQKLLADSISRAKVIEERVLSKGEMATKPEKIVVNGFVVKTNVYPGFILRFLTATFPISIEIKPSYFDRIFKLKKSSDTLVNGQIGQSFLVNVSENQEELHCGSLTDFFRCMEELSVKSDSHLEQLAKKYNFPVEFLKEASEMNTKFSEKEKQKKLSSDFKKDIIAEYKKEHRYSLNRSFIKVEVDTITTTLWQLYQQDSWLGIFKHWQILAEQNKATKIHKAERTLKMGLIMGIIGWVLMVFASFTIKSTVMFFVFGISIIVVYTVILFRISNITSSSDKK